MTFRARLLIGALIVAVLPLAGVAVIVRGEMRATVTEIEQDRVAGDAGRVAGALDAVMADLDRRTAGLVQQLEGAHAVRQALQGLMDRRVLAEWPGLVLSGTGMDVFWLLDRDGTILASAQAPQDTGRVAVGWTDLPPGEAVVADLARDSTGLRVLAVMQEVTLDGRRIHVVAGRMLAPVLAGLGRGPVAVTFSEVEPSPGATVRAIGVPVFRLGTWSRGAFVLARDPATLQGILGRLDRSFLLVGAAAVLLALLASLLLARGISAPIERLAERTGGLDLERLDVVFAPDRADELGQLERTLAALVARLKSSVATLRDAERRAAVGDVARQVNHDIKNGLIPIKNVLRHLVETAEQDPERTAAILIERRGTLEASVTYLEQLAANYAKLTPAVTSGTTDLAGVVRAAVEAARRDGLSFDTEVYGDVTVAGDSVAMRRIVENLIGNARDAARTTVRVVCKRGEANVTLAITDDGSGMSDAELERAFEGFHTTKAGGTGLGLTVVRRLVQDLGGSLKVSTEPGRGTTVHVALPAG